MDVPFLPGNPVEELGGGQGKNDLTDPLTCAVYDSPAADIIRC